MKKQLIVIAILIFLSACKINKNNTSNASVEKIIAHDLVVSASGKNKPELPYQPSAKRVNDLQHMELRVRFDYAKQHVIGKAVLTVRPFFHPVTKLELDAKTFDIRRVAMLGKDTQDLKYTYASDVITIDLGREYKSSEQYRIYIDYTAKPNESKEKGSFAITDAKGLYFINPLRDDPDKPRQIWTQGETQSSSGWFPTIDRPNEKFTHEIYITADEKDVTLSNGELIYSRINSDRTHTDLWKQSLPHAPYLVMMAIGEFTITKDHWRDSIEVNYYLEPAYQPYAKLIFGHTPEMIECFSKRLGVDYPWEKFSQIVVRDFVSGAMENTSAVVHFEPVQHDAREHLDNTWESIISHELFHHWFGDLVTCESWSNIPLNESFATYGSYLWDEYKYGKMEADCSFDDNLQAYLGYKAKHNTKVIRYHYGSREDMFDVVSYQKGGRILHMLRNYLGDDAFFKGLQVYLTEHRFGTVEVHDLRLALEKVSGEDLNWFFDQWFLNSGHPVLKVNEDFTDNRKKVTIRVEQTQDSTKGLYRLPVAVDVYTSKGSKRTAWTIEAQRSQSIALDADEPILFVNVDADQVLLAEVSNEKTLPEFEQMLLRAPLYMDKSEAADGITASMGDTASEGTLQVIRYALGHPFHGVRSLGIDMAQKLNESQFAGFEAKIISIAKSDPVSDVRNDAIMLLAEADAAKYKDVFLAGVKDSSYMVIGSSIQALAETDTDLALKEAAAFRDAQNGNLQATYAQLLSEHSKGDHIAYFEQRLGKYGLNKYGIINSYGIYLRNADTTILLRALPGLKAYYQKVKDKDLYSTIILTNGVADIWKSYKDAAEDLEEAMEKLKPADPARKELLQKIAAKRSIMRQVEETGILPKE